MRLVITVVDETERILEDARMAGIDLNLIDCNLALSVEERLRQHDAALGFILKLQAAKREHDARLQPAAR